LTLNEAIQSRGGKKVGDKMEKVDYPANTLSKRKGEEKTVAELSQGCAVHYLKYNSVEVNGRKKRKGRFLRMKKDIGVRNKCI